MDIIIRNTERTHMSDVIDLLSNNLSDFRPRDDELDAIWLSFSTQNNVQSVVALFDNTVVGYGAMTIETKIRGGRMGHVEDIVSHEKFRNKGIGKTILNALAEIAKDMSCYKMTLQCKESNVVFYEKLGYAVSGVTMQRFLK